MQNIACGDCGCEIPLDAQGRPAACSFCNQSRQPAAASSRTARLRALAVGTQPNAALCVTLALLAAATFFGLGPWLLLRDTYVFHLFCGHGWVPYVCVLLFFIAFWMLALKFPLIRREYRAFDLELLPEDADSAIDMLTSQKILARISRLAKQRKNLLLVARIRQALMRLNQLGTAEKLDDLLRYRADADFAAVESSYAAPRFIIWAIPVLGFVGTVLGISNGVSAFSTLIQNASNLSGLRQSLKGVTYGLGQAFETTMIALCMSLLLMLLMSIVQRREDQLLAAIDDYSMEHLLQKARRGHLDAANPATGPADLHHAITSLVKRLDALLKLHESPAVQTREQAASSPPPTTNGQPPAPANTSASLGPASPGVKAK